MQTKAVTFVGNGLSRVLPCEVGIIPASITGTDRDKQPMTAQAIWDTGATASAITSKIAKGLNLAPIRVTQVHTAGGTKNCNVYIVDLLLPNDVRVTNVAATEADILTTDVLIGMDIIALGDFAVSNFGGKTCFTFRIPSMRRMDFVKEIDQQRPSRKPGLGKSKAKRKLERKTKRWVASTIIKNQL